MQCLRILLSTSNSAEILARRSALTGRSNQFAFCRSSLRCVPWCVAIWFSLISLRQQEICKYSSSCHTLGVLIRNFSDHPFSTRWEKFSDSQHLRMSENTLTTVQRPSKSALLRVNVLMVKIISFLLGGAVRIRMLRWLAILSKRYGTFIRSKIEVKCPFHFFSCSSSWKKAYN